MAIQEALGVNTTWDRRNLFTHPGFRVYTLIYIYRQESGIHTYEKDRNKKYEAI